jgi:hypothetical protein
MVVNGQTVPDSRAGTWSFYCLASSACRASTNTDGWCELSGARDAQQNLLGVTSLCAAPSRARVSFALDTWGRINDDIAHDPYALRFNARWQKLAVNLVGTGVRDCAHAADSQQCYTEPFLRYLLTHAGPSWVQTYEGAWRLVEVPLGRIEGAKALADEQWLDPLNNSWTKPYVDAVARTEFVDRPFDGSYTIELTTGPEVRFDRIESVQILLQSAYWTRQQ